MWKIMINHGIVGYPSPIFGQTHIAPLPRTQKRCGKRHEGHRHGTENTPTNHLKIKSCSQAWPFPCTIPLSSTFFDQRKHTDRVTACDHSPMPWTGLFPRLARASPAMDCCVNQWWKRGTKRGKPKFQKHETHIFIMIDPYVSSKNSSNVKHITKQFSVSMNSKPTKAAGARFGPVPNRSVQDLSTKSKSIHPFKLDGAFGFRWPHSN